MQENGLQKYRKIQLEKCREMETDVEFVGIRLEFGKYMNVGWKIYKNKVGKIQRNGNALGNYKKIDIDLKSTGMRKSLR